MFKSRILLALTVMLLMAGSIQASNRARAHDKRSVTGARGAISAGGGYAVRGEIEIGSGSTAEHATVDDDVLSAGPWRLSGELGVVFTTDDNAVQSRPGDEDAQQIATKAASRFEKLASLLGQWGACDQPEAPCEGDWDDDGVVGPADVRLLIASW